VPPAKTAATEIVASGSRQLVIFTLAGEDYALPIACIQEVIRYTKPRDVLSPDPSVTGVVDLRGKIVPVCDLASRLGVPGTDSEDRKIVILETDQATAGVIVDAVDQVILIQDSQLERSPASNTNIVEAIARLNDRLVVLLNTDTLVSSTARIADQADVLPQAA